MLGGMRRAVPVIFPFGRRGRERRPLIGRVVPGLGRVRQGRCGAGRQVPLDAHGVYAVGDKDGQQQYGKGQHARQHRGNASQRYTPRRPSRNHAVTLTARRGRSTNSPEIPGLTSHTHGPFASATTQSPKCHPLLGHSGEQSVGRGVSAANLFWAFGYNVAALPWQGPAGRQDC